MKRCKQKTRHCERPKGAKQSPIFSKEIASSLTSRKRNPVYWTFAPRNDGRVGRIHSFESFGTQDGPGIRYVVFLQGCLARCVYCHNPDTWDLKAGFEMSAKEVFERIDKTAPYLKASGGGVTISGGEPLLQADFLIELFKLCKKASIHTCIDTSGFYVHLKHPHVPPRGCSFYGRKVSQVIDLTDLFLVDLKALDPKLHKKITGRDISEVLSFISMLEKKKKPYWLRYVLVPGLNDKKST